MFTVVASMLGSNNHYLNVSKITGGCLSVSRLAMLRVVVFMAVHALLMSYAGKVKHVERIVLPV